MITDAILLGLIAALALLGSTHLLETVLYVLRRLFASGPGHLLSLAAESGFNLQLATSLRLSWLRLTRRARTYPHPSPPRRPYGLPVLTLISLVCISLFLVLEVAVVYVTRPRTVFQSLSQSRVPIFHVGLGHDRNTAEINSEEEFELRSAVFNDSTTSRHVCIAVINTLDIVSSQFQALDRATREPGTSFSIHSLIVADGFNEDGTPIDSRTGLRKTANLISFYVNEYSPNNRMITLAPYRAIEALDLSRTTIFSDFNEPEARVFETEVLRGWRLSCDAPKHVLEGVLQVSSYACKSTESLEILESPGAGPKKSLAKALIEVGRRIFYINGYDSERRGEVSGGRMRPGEPIRAIFGRYAGVEARSSGFVVVCIAAFLGVVRLISGVFIDFRGVAEKVMFKAVANGSTLGGPGEWDGKDECEWRVYRTSDGNRLGYTREEWSDDRDTPEFQEGEGTMSGEEG